MTIQVKSVFLSAALAALILPVSAQTVATTPIPDPPAQQPKEQNVQHRYQSEQTRIADGMKNGDLTEAEAKTLEQKQADLNREAVQMKKANGGKLSAADRAKLEGQQNQLSRQIYQQKHDAQKANVDPNSAAGKRMEAQQDRIAQGVQNGSLTANEAAHLENQQSNLNREAKSMRQENGGTLTNADKAKLYHQQRKDSRNIYHQKHDNQHR
jgi:hypothetical protein